MEEVEESTYTDLPPLGLEARRLRVTVGTGVEKPIEVTINQGSYQELQHSRWVDEGPSTRMRHSGKETQSSHPTT